MVFPNGLSVSSTELSYYEVNSRDKLPWQTPHHHRGKTEVYVLLSGWAAFVWTDADQAKWGIISEPGEAMAFTPGCDHNVLLGPDSHIGTMIFGEPVGNPDRNDNDWWPAPEGFDDVVFDAKSQVVGVLREREML